MKNFSENFQGAARKIRLAVGVFLLSCMGLSAAEQYVADGAKLSFDRKKGALALSLPGAPSEITVKQLWDIRFFDSAAMEANRKSYREFGVGCSQNYVESKDALQPWHARLKKYGFDSKSGCFRAEYDSDRAGIEMLVNLADGAAEFQLKVTNRSEQPISMISLFPGMAFSLGENTLTVPQPDFVAAEADGCPRCYYYNSNYTWNGVLVTSPGGGCFAFDLIRNLDERNDTTINHIDGDKETGRKLRWSNEYLCWVRKGETRSTPILRLKAYPGLSDWAAAYVKHSFPSGLKTLRERYSPDLFDRLSHAYWLPAEGKIADLTALVSRIPGRIMLHNAYYMHPLKGTKLRQQLDAFPNHFPVNPYFGSDDELVRLIGRVVDAGGIYVPRTSFFYWVKGSDFALGHDLSRSAVVRVDGRPTTARWGNLPGYLISPSDKTAASYRNAIREKFRSMGTNGYFSNVITAVQPGAVRYDFHPDAPAPDLLFTEIAKMFRECGRDLPLFSEGGSFWQLALQAGFCNDMRDNPYRSDLLYFGQHLKNGRQNWAPVLMLTHEYIINLPHNLGTNDATTSIPRLTHSLLNGFLLKGGILPKLTVNNILWLRTAAIFSEEISSRLIGRRLLEYRRKDGVATADYSGSVVTANYTDEDLLYTAGKNRGKIAPEGFGFHNSAEGVTAGYFSEWNGISFPAPVLLLAAEKAEGTRLYAPLETAPLKLVWNDVSCEIPAYPAILERKVRGVTLAKNGCVADAPGKGTVPPEGRAGEAKRPAGSGYPAAVPLAVDWSSGSPLPENLHTSGPVALTEEGIRLNGKNGCVTLRLPNGLSKALHAELLVRYDRMPSIPDKPGTTPFFTTLRKPGEYFWTTRTVEFGYHLFSDEFRAHCVSSGNQDGWITTRDFVIKPGHWYHVALTVGDGKQTLTINGRSWSRPFAGALKETSREWQIGDPFAAMTIGMIRFGGE